MKLKHVLLMLVSWLCTISLYAQVTTASMNGAISDEKGEGLIGATVVAKHLPSGTQYGVVTNNDGRFTIPNMRVGGPYEVIVSYVGFKNEKFAGISLQLGQKFVFNATLKGESATLQEVVVKADPVMNGTRTGAALNIDNTQLQTLPTISRSAADYTRLTPLAAEGGSFGGRNSQYNNYSLDGAIFNNPFGLDAATPGGQTDAQAVSLDAIDQILERGLPGLEAGAAARVREHIAKLGHGGENWVADGMPRIVWANPSTSLFWAAPMRANPPSSTP